MVAQRRTSLSSTIIELLHDVTMSTHRTCTNLQITCAAYTRSLGLMLKGSEMAGCFAQYACAGEVEAGKKKGKVNRKGDGGYGG